MGGDEFAILLEAASTSDNMNAILDRIMDNVIVPHETNGISFESGTSIGVVMNVPAYDRIDDILRDADIAMYRAKASGGNRIQLFSCEIFPQSENRASSEVLQLRADLKS